MKMRLEGKGYPTPRMSDRWEEIKMEGERLKWGENKRLLLFQEDLLRSKCVMKTNHHCCVKVTASARGKKDDCL